MRTLRTSALCFCAFALGACAGLPISIPTGGTGGTGGSGGTKTGAGSGTTTTAPSSVANDIVRYTNDARVRNGLPPFGANANLMEAARVHAQQMAQFQRSDHTISGAQYPTLVSRLQAVGYSYSNAAENVAWNQRDAQSVVTGWMNSSGHRANILDPNLHEIGAAMARSSKGEPYWIQVFGTPR
jgi:uncharacterized protein YkwD